MDISIHLSMDGVSLDRTALQPDRSPRKVIVVLIALSCHREESGCFLDVSPGKLPLCQPHDQYL